MRSWYWVIEAVIGALLLIAPFVEGFTQQRMARFTDVFLGILVMFWASVGYFNTWFLFEK
ncbi:MAG TPA: SPW repeat protein [Candidatus Methylomirabilis sp.]|nr:SPW repeat protein [Candidatus Methylomirabilis sp.]